MEEENKKSGGLWLAVVVVIVAVGVFLATGGQKGATMGPITIGFIGPLTGDAANVGQNAKAAVELAVSEVNGAGGINGRSLQVIYEDGKCNGSSASSAANKLMNIDKVPVILGGACSGETMSFTGAAEQSKTVVLSYCSSNPAITNAGDYIFRDYPSDSFQGSYAADYLYTTLGKKKVAIMYTKTDWGKGLVAVFKDKFIKNGGAIVAEEGIDQTSRDVRTSIAKIKASQPDALYFPGYSNESIVGITQARELGFAAPLFGGDAWDDSKIWTTVGSAGEGAMYIKVASNPGDAFKSALAAKVGSNEVGPCSPTAYDGLKILAQVVGTVGTDSTAIKNELYKTVYTGGVSSDKIQFDQNGDLVGANYAVMKVHNGAASPVTK